MKRIGKCVEALMSKLKEASKSLTKMKEVQMVVAKTGTTSNKILQSEAFKRMLCANVFYIPSTDQDVLEDMPEMSTGYFDYLGLKAEWAVFGVELEYMFNSVSFIYK